MQTRMYFPESEWRPVHVAWDVVVHTPCSGELAAWPAQSINVLQVVRSLKALLRERTGTVLVRDYAEGDLAEQRLSSHGPQRKLAQNFYVRGDGTRCYYFTTVCQLTQAHS